MMVRLGLRLTLRSGREGLVRLVLTAVAVAIGVAVLLAVLAEFHAFQATSGRPCWECTEAARGTSDSTLLLWNFSENIYQGKFIEELDLAALGPDASLPPGLSRLPRAGEYYASPALAELLDTVPSDQLGDRFPGTRVGLIGDQALSGPGALVIMIGYTPDVLTARPSTIRVDHIATAPQTQGTTNLYRIAFGLGAIAILFPILILIGTATRLAAARREERYAAMRLVGATPRQINVIASADAAVSAFAGTILGISLFQSLRPTLADVALSGARFFPETVTPTFEGYVAIVVFVPLAAAAAAMVSLRRVRVSPLAARTRVTPAAPGWWRVLPLPVGIAVFAAALTSWPRSGTSGGPNPGLLFAGTLLIMGGLISGGTWLTGQAAHLMARHGRAASSLLAARRLADNPRAAFRSVSGLVLAVFVGSGIALLAPTVQAVQSGAGGDVSAGFNTVLRVPVGEHLSARGAADLMSSLGTFPGVALLPLYALEQGGGVETPTGEFVGPGPRTAVECSRLEQFPALGTCPPGATGASVDPDAIQALLTDNPLYLYKALPVVDATSPPVATDLTGSTLAILLVKTNDADILERVRTFLTTYGAQTSTLPGGGRALERVADGNARTGDLR